MIVHERASRRRRAGADDPGNALPGPAAQVPRSASASRGGDHHAAGSRADRVRVQPVDRPDPDRDRNVCGARDRHRLLPPKRDHVAGKRSPHRERSRVHPARAGDAARRLVEPSRSVDLRGHGRRLAPVEAPDPLAGPPHLQPLELRARPLLPGARREPCRATRLLVGPDVPLARVGDRTHRRRRPDHPLATPPSRHRRGLLARVCSRDRSACGKRPLDDGPMAPGTDHGFVVLVAARDLARDPDLPVFHDHRPDDDPERARRPCRVRRVRRAARDASDCPADDRVRDQGRRAGRARPGLCGTPPRRATPSGGRLAGRSRFALGTRTHATRMGLDRRADSRGGRFCGTRGGGGHSGAPGCCDGELPARGRAHAAGERHSDRRRLGQGRFSDCDSDRARHRRGSPRERGCAPSPRPSAGGRRCRRCVARRSPPADRGCGRQVDLGLELSNLERRPDADARSGSGAAQNPGFDQGHRAGRRLSRPATEAGESTRPGSVQAIAGGGSPTGPLRHRPSRRSDGGDNDAAC